MGWLERERRQNPESGKVESYWSIRDRVNGRKRKRSLGYLTEREAEQLLKMYEGDKARGKGHVGDAPPTSAPNSKVSPLLREWWGEGREWPKSARMYSYYLARGVSAGTVEIIRAARLQILSALGDRRLDQIRAAEADQFVSGLREKGLRTRTIQIYLHQLQRCLQVAVDDGILAAAPKLPRPRLGERKVSLFHTPAQSERLLQTLQERVDAGDLEDRSQLAIFMTLSLGLRRGECLTRRWEDIDWNGGGKLHIRNQKMPGGALWQPKTRTARTVPLGPPLKKALAEAWLKEGRQGSGWIFPSKNGDGWPMKDFRRALRTSCRLAGLPELHPHALRHSAATRWAWAGVDRPTAMRLGGWKSAEMLDEVYAHSDEGRMEEAMVRTAVGGMHRVQSADRGLS